MLIRMINGSNAKNNEEYRKVVKTKIKLACLIILLGILSLIGMQIINNNDSITMSDYMKGFYTGASSGLIMAGIMLLIKYICIIKNETKLKEARLNAFDERIVAIQGKTLKCSAITMLITAYIMGFVGGIFAPELTVMLLLLVVVFFFTYIIAYKIYEQKM